MGNSLPKFRTHYGANYALLTMAECFIIYILAVRRFMLDLSPTHKEKNV